MRKTPWAVFDPVTGFPLLSSTHAARRQAQRERATRPQDPFTKACGSSRIKEKVIPETSQFPNPGYGRACFMMMMGVPVGSSSGWSSLNSVSIAYHPEEAVP